MDRCVGTDTEKVKYALQIGCKRERLNLQVIRVGLGNFGTAKIDSPNMLPLQGIHRETGLESDRE